MGGLRRCALRVLGALVFLIGGCGDPGARQYAGTPTTAVEAYGACAYCHGQAERLFVNGGHGGFDLDCRSCHDAVEAENPGPGHYEVPACADCHAEQRTHHDRATVAAEQCTTCHTPHGSANLLLVRTRIEAMPGVRVPLVFDNLAGHGDGGFTSQSRPGSGVCEVCHTQTRYYRADGSGEPHFEFPCYTCHPHTNGFSPMPAASDASVPAH